MVCENLDGILIVDKPANMSSAAVVRVVKKVLQADKVGHAGTLDPFAEGVLICCINRATRLAGFLSHGDKKYVATLKLGTETDTQDQTGTVVSTAETVGYSRQTIQTACESFKGVVEQLPPVYSALKHRGVPLYKLARRGKPVQKPPRRVQIYDIVLKKVYLPYVCFEVACSAGTYIRTLGADIGKKLGCGGHLVALKRTESSGFKLNQAISLPELKELTINRQWLQKIISMKDSLPDIPNYYADERLAQKIRHGQKLSLNDLCDLNLTDRAIEKSKYLKMIDRNDDLIAIVEYAASKEHPKYACVFHKS
jgi:tRNA pseudouridine55 synthase